MPGMPRNYEAGRCGKGQTDFFMKNKEPKFPLPKPIELAKLAAILRPESQPTAAIKVAVQFYIEAVQFCKGSSTKTWEELEFGSEKRWLEHVEQIEKAVEERWKDTLELDPDKPTDPARQFLAKRGLDLKTLSVLNHIRKWWKAEPRGVGVGSSPWWDGRIEPELSSLRADPNA